MVMAMVETDDWVQLYTDGSSLGTPGPGGWAWLYFGGGAARTYDSGAAREPTTNNRMELLAACRGLEAARALNRKGLLVYCDSQYVIKGLTLWIKGWKRRGWRTASGGSVLNVSLWQRLDALHAEIAPRWIWVRGHTGNPHNEFVDRLARAASERSRVLLAGRR